MLLGRILKLLILSDDDYDSFIREVDLRYDSQSTHSIVINRKLSSSIYVREVLSNYHYFFIGDDDVLMQDAEDNPAQIQRLRFITSVNAAKNAMKDAEQELNKV